MKLFSLRFSIVVASTLLAAAHADVTLPAIFGDHMVLQQEASLPIWGEADPGEKITVKFVGQQVTTTARADRKWRVNLRPIYLRSSPDVLTIDGKNHLEFTDVLVGDVWLCAGQSNMAFPLREAEGGEEAILHAEDEQLRLFVVPEKRALRPQSQLQGHWERCVPETAASFSAVGYFFGRDVRMATGIPIGLIGSYCSGSSAQAWMGLAALQQAPSFSAYLAEYHQTERNFLKNQETYPQQKNNYQQALAIWEEQIGNLYQTELAAWKLKCKEACSKLLAQPLKPEPASPRPVAPLPPDGGVTAPAVLFNAMIAPLIPYAISGVVWYQGESNENQDSPYSWMADFPHAKISTTIPAVFEYRRLFQRLIRSWRAAWGEGPFPFYFVSLAGFRKTTLDPIEMLVDDEGNSNPGWAWLREGQAMALFLPETGMAVATDLGAPDDIHPKDKLSVGRRLALLARRNLYGQPVMASGPTYRGMKQEGKTLRLSFDHVGRGLTVAGPPWRYHGYMTVLRSVQGFAIAGNDRHWYEATALINGQDVIVSSELVSQPTAVRYNWKDNPTGNLYNREGLPAVSFRTDADQPR